MALETLGTQGRLIVDAPFARELSIGDSVAINGCCLTAVAIKANAVTFDVLYPDTESNSAGQFG